MHLGRLSFMSAAVFVVMASVGCGGTHSDAYYGATTIEKAFADHGITLSVFLPFRQSNALQVILAPVDDPAVPPSVEVDVFRNTHSASVYLSLLTGPQGAEKGTQILRQANVVVLYRSGSRYQLTSVRGSLRTLG